MEGGFRVFEEGWWRDWEGTGAKGGFRGYA